MPMVFAPIMLQALLDRCAATIPGWIDRARHNPSTLPVLKEFAAAIIRWRDGSVLYIKLLDRGLVDNYGLSEFIIALLSAEPPHGPR